MGYHRERVSSGHLGSDQNFKLNDTHLATIGMGESNESGDGGKIEILIYPVGATASSVQKKAAEKH